MLTLIRCYQTKANASSILPDSWIYNIRGSKVDHSFNMTRWIFGYFITQDENFDDEGQGSLAFVDDLTDLRQYVENAQMQSPASGSDSCHQTLQIILSKKHIRASLELSSESIQWHNCWCVCRVRNCIAGQYIQRQNESSNKLERFKELILPTAWHIWRHAKRI